MAFITRAEYDELYPGNTISEEDFPALAEIASSMVDELALFRISCCGLDKFPEAIQDKIKAAVAAQISTIYEQGGLEAVEGWGADSSFNSATIGKFAYSGGNGTSSGGKTDTLRSIPISPLVYSYLLPTGLLYRGIGVICSG